MARIPLPDLDDMTEGSDLGLLDFVKFGINYQQNLATAKNRDRNQSAAIMTRAAQGISVNSSAEDIEDVMQFIESKAGDDIVKQDFAEATNQLVGSTLERRQGMDKFAQLMLTTKDELRAVQKKGREGIYDVSAAQKIIDDLENNYLNNIRHIAGQTGLTTMLNNNLTEARDVYTAISLMDQLDAVDYTEGIVESLGIQLPEGTEDLTVKYLDRDFARKEMAEFAQSAYDANNYTKVSKILGLMLSDSQGRGMRLANDVKALNPYYDTAFAELSAITKEGQVDSEYPVMPVLKDLIKTARANMILSPKDMESAFDLLSQYIYDVSKDEETFEGWFGIGDVPDSVSDLDRYLNENTDRLMRDLDSDNIGRAVKNLITVRRGIAKAYKEAYGKNLIIDDEDFIPIKFK